MAIPAPFDLPLDTFLKGERATRELDIDVNWGQDFEDFLEEHRKYFPTEFNTNNVRFITRSDITSEIRYYQTEVGVVAIGPGSIPVGCYFWSSLTLSEDWQGNGLGRELVIITLVSRGDNPVWNLDIPAYSPAGLAAHESAWRYMQELHRSKD